MATDQRLPVVFLHSAGLTPQMWQSQVEAVGAVEPGPDSDGIQAVAPWLAGLRPGKQSELSLSRGAAEVASTLDRFGIERARLVGHQLGAMVALEFAAAEPERVAGLVLSGAMVAPGKMALKFQKSLIRMLPNQSLEQSGATKDDLIRALDLMATADFGGRADRITAPVLVIAGSDDPGLPAAQALAALLPNAQLKELDGVGSNPNLEDPEAYNRALVEFLA